MKKRTKISFLATLVCCVSLAVLLSSCFGAPNEEEDAAKANRGYMSQVNTVMEELNTNLESFSTAVSESDLVGMKTQADKALLALDDLEALEAPESLKEVQQNYVDGSRALQSALNDYVELYSELAIATQADPFDYSTYAERLESIQKSYDEGIEKIKEADKKANELP